MLSLNSSSDVLLYGMMMFLKWMQIVRNLSLTLLNMCSLHYNSFTALQVWLETLDVGQPSKMQRQANRHTDTRTDTQRDKQTDKQTNEIMVRGIYGIFSSAVLSVKL